MVHYKSKADKGRWKDILWDTECVQKIEKKYPNDAN
jgi:hypothetical protein